MHNGSFEDIEDFQPASTHTISLLLPRNSYLFIPYPPPEKHKHKYKDLPQELQDQWKKDRDKKAENKRRRELDRLVLAADPLSKKKGGKKGQKAMFAVSNVDPTITVIPNRIIDMTTLVQQIRRFLANVGGPSTMSLPPTNKETRKDIHEMATAFGLHSQSKGKGGARYTTLIKTSKSGIAINEEKVARIVRRRSGAGGGELVGRNGRGGRVTSVPKHREGDEVGKVCSFGFFPCFCGTHKVCF